MIKKKYGFMPNSRCEFKFNCDLDLISKGICLFLGTADDGEHILNVCIRNLLNYAFARDLQK